MKNKDELNKRILLILVISLIALLGMLCFDMYKYRTYTKNYNNYISNLVNVIKENYSDIEDTEIVDVLNGKSINNSDFLKKYGIDIETESIILENDKVLKKYMIYDGIFLVLILVLVVGILLIYNYKKDKEIEKIIDYLNQINRFNYDLKIDDNSEGELSILKNEIYKTTVTLKEQMEISKKDKLNLKKSMSDISHQLKTPLTSIMIMLDNINNDLNMDVKIRRKFIKEIKREIANINFLVGTLLKLSKLDANAIVFNNENVSVDELCHEAIVKVSALRDLKNVKINVSGDKKVIINCDLSWQVEAISNILKNALEAVDNDGKIDIICKDNKVYTSIIIKDYGKGISEKDLPNIFNRFYKGENANRDSIGIGLALAKSIIESNNGKVEVKSKLGRGTTFVIKYYKI